jgi:formylglycine-generating enzyme required for sulfatase activity
VPGAVAALLREVPGAWIAPCEEKMGESGYEDYRSDIALEGSAVHVVRGGAFDDLAGLVRCASRDYRLYPNDRFRNLGFRVVVSPFSRTQ